MSKLSDLKRTIKYPTSLIVRGGDKLGFELAKSLLEQGGYVILIDYLSEANEFIVQELETYELFTFVELSEIYSIESYLRRLDYVFYLSHSFEDVNRSISSQEFLELSKFLDYVLDLSNAYEAKFLATTSIKAHQYLVEHKPLETNFKTSAEVHTIYTEAEIQRYTESLTKEYISKANLDARIIRLGELMGAYSALNKENEFFRLISQALSEDELTIYGDGLDSDYYIHFQDAVYGIVKAQFSKNTVGEIFSVCYENPVSVLSLVYKINELLDHPKEINFVESKSDSDYSLSLYKPAPNLMRIGWHPRVSFERSVRQSFEDVKKYITVNKRPRSENLGVSQLLQSNKRKGIQDLISWIFFDKPSKSAEQQEIGAVARLINERKNQENARKGSIVMANHTIENQHREPVGLFNSLTKGFDRLMSNFDSLRYVTVRQLLFMIVVGIVFIIFYFAIFVPAVNMAKNLVIGRQSITGLESTIRENDISQASENVESLLNETEEFRNEYSKFGFLESSARYRMLGASIDSFYFNLNDYNRGLNDALSGFGYVYNYLNETPPPQLVYLPNSQTSLLEVQNNTEEAPGLSVRSTNSSITALGVDEMDKALGQLENLNLPINNSTYVNYYNRMVENLSELHQRASDYVEVEKYLPRLIGGDEDKSYVIIVTDRNVPMPLGGYPYSEIKITFNNGKLIDIIVDEFDYDGELVEPPEYMLSEVNALSPVVKSREDLVLGDLFFLQNSNLYMNEFEKYYEESIESEINGIFIIDLNTITGLMQASNPEPFEIEGVSTTPENVVTNIGLLVEGNPDSEDYKAKLITTVTALAAKEVLENFNSNILEYKNLIKSAIQNKQILFTSEEFIDDDNVQDRINDEASDFITIAPTFLNTNLRSRANPHVKMNINTRVIDSTTIRKGITFDLTQFENYSEFSVCMPATASNFVFEQALDNIKTLQSGVEKTCLTVPQEYGKNITFSYDNFVALEDGYYTFGIRKHPGVNTSYNLNLSADSDIAFSSDGEQIQNLSFSGELEDDEVIKVEVIY